jgi:hypothetical protein
MSISGSILLGTGTVPATPSSGLVTIYNDTADGRFKYLGSDGLVKSMGSTIINSTTGASSGINNTETIISGGTNSLHLSANELTAGTLIRITCYGTCTSSAGNTSNFNVYYGANGTTADTKIATITSPFTAQTTGASVLFKASQTLTVRTIGASGTVYGYFELLNTGTAGIYTAPGPFVWANTFANINTTNAGYFNVSYVASNTTTTCTFQQVIIEVIKQ